MAVYTHLGAEELAALIARYDVGELTSAKGIAEGVSNSNWLIETTHGRYILTMYERRIDLDDLPYFLGLLDHLSAKGCPVPRTIHDLDGAAFRMERGKAVALIEFLPGVSPTQPTAIQARNVGEVLARMHAASVDFPLTRGNTMSFADNLMTLERFGEAGLAAIDTRLSAMMQPARKAAELDLSGLPKANVHADLFPDNVLMLAGAVTGLIDFYFACYDAQALDLAVTHAAWCFDDRNRYRAELGEALVSGYESVRPLEATERAMLPEIAKGVALRFCTSRAEDWLDTPNDALVIKKDPMQFVARWEFYDEFGAELFS
ncbi:MAG: homoserine kinase [Pseudomonadota bacterium]